MTGHPTAAELLAAVRDFLATLDLDGRDAFHAKVAANALAIVERELAAPPAVMILGRSEAELCAAIRSSHLDVASPGLLDALIAATCARLRVDNPRYATLVRLGGDAAGHPGGDAAARR